MIYPVSPLYLSNAMAKKSFRANNLQRVSPPDFFSALLMYGPEAGNVVASAGTQIARTMGLGDDENAPRGSHDVIPTATPPTSSDSSWVSSAGNAASSILSAIFGPRTPAGYYPPGYYPPQPTGISSTTVLLLGGMAILGVVLLTR